MAIAESKTRTKYPLSRKKIIKKSFAPVIGWSIALVIFGAAAYFIIESIKGAVPLPSWIQALNIGSVFGILIFLCIINYIYQVMYFNRYFYDLTDHFIVIRKGVIIPAEISMPYERIQDVYMDQDILDRIFGIYDVHLSTATYTSGMQAHIDGLEKEAAEGLKNELLKILHEKIQKKPVAKEAPPPDEPKS